ncbi:MAG: transposase [Proteobacteria bacterium]|nr:transposase [Pseudomonadota bacterium]
MTICTKERKSLFGKIIGEEIRLNACGRIAENCWASIPFHFENTFLHEFIVMPNHIHGVIEIINTVEARFVALDKNLAGAMNRAPTDDTNGGKGGFSEATNPMLHMNLSRIIRWYKGRTTFECKSAQFMFAWQRNYYEHVIRGEQDYLRIAEYIRSNPVMWKKDVYYQAE